MGRPRADTSAGDIASKIFDREETASSRITTSSSPQRVLSVSRISCNVSVGIDAAPAMSKTLYNCRAREARTWEEEDVLIRNAERIKTMINIIFIPHPQQWNLVGGEEEGAL
jgi:hypothetical protein